MIENASKLNSQAIEFASKGDYKEAIACLKKAITLENDNALLWFNLGVTYRDCGDFVMANQSLEKAYDLDDGNDDEIIETLALVNFNAGLIEEAIECCKSGLYVNSQNSHLWNTLGVIFFNQDKYEMASEFFEKAITINPYYYDALFNLRDTYLETGNQAGYLMCMQQMKEIKGQSL